jgi:hypothetical protein
MIVFALGSAFAFLASTQGSFGDISIWGFVGLAMTAMSFFTWRSAKKTQSSHD